MLQNVCNRRKAPNPSYRPSSFLLVDSFCIGKFCHVLDKKGLREPFGSCKLNFVVSDMQKLQYDEIVTKQAKGLYVFCANVRGFIETTVVHEERVKI